MPLGKVKRRMLWVAAAAVFLVLLILASIPFWFPLVLRSLGSDHGLSYQSVRRDGYATFTLQNVEFTNGPIAFHADTFHAYQPGAWLWNLRRGRPAGNYASASGWSLNLSAREVVITNASSKSESTYTNLIFGEHLLAQVRRWLPAASLTNGVINAEGKQIRVPELQFRGSELTGRFSITNVQGEFAFRLQDKGQHLDLHLQNDALELASEISIVTNATGVTVQSTNLWQSNSVLAMATFERAGVLPAAASLSAEGMRIPASLLETPEYEVLVGTLRGTWEKEAFQLSAELAGKPAAGTTNLPPANLELVVSGDTNHVFIESAHLSSAPLTADLSKHLEVHFTGPLLREPAQLRVAVDLSHQEWVAATGKLEGEVAFTPFTGKFPIADFRLKGTGIGSYSLTAERLDAQGRFQWPSLALQKLEIVFDDKSTAAADGELDLKAQTMSRVRVRAGGGLGQRWLPAGYAYQLASLDARLDGPWKQPIHHGELSVTNFTLQAVEPISGVMHWSGNGFTQAEAAVSLATSNGAAKTRLTFQRDEQQISAQLAELDLLSNNVSVLKLQRPASLSLAQTRGKNWEFELNDLHLSAPGSGLAAAAHVRWPGEGGVQLHATNLSTALLEPFLLAKVERVDVPRLAFEGYWSNGPAQFALNATVAYHQLTNYTQKLNRIGPLDSAIATATINADSKGLTISNLSTSVGSSNVLVATGFLPVTFHPASTDFINWESGAAMDFRAATEPGSLLWDKLAALTGITVSKPELKVALTGTAEAPNGKVLLKARELRLPRRASPLPIISDLNFELGLERKQAWLTNCQVNVEGQPVLIRGEMPLDQKFWNEVSNLRQPDLGKASAEIRIDHAQLSAFADLFPAILSPQGELSLNVRLVPGGDLKGTLGIEKARSRPLPGVGPLRDIEVHLAFANRVVQLTKASARVGTSTVTATGQGDLSGTDWLHGVAPKFDFALYGTNVPLSRQPSSIIRSDLLLTVIKTNDLPPLISGVARLRDSYYLSDLSDLVPGKVSTPARRPPYFSIEDPGLADWRLNVLVTGERGVKVRTTIFSGVAGPNMRLQGTLKEPLILGDVRIASGAVRLPFATLDVQQGLVTLSSDDPYRPKLQINATSKRFGYDVRMEVTGPADQPVIQFTSTPPLSSEQLLLMMTAGELPRGGYTLTPEQRAQTVALFLGKDLLAKLGFGDSSEERLTFSSGEDISEAGKPTYGVEYKLTKRWSIEGEYDRFNAFNAGVKYKVYSR